MDECFRFLINVDQCLNMSYFDIFFYKLQSEKKYKLNQVQLFETADTSLQRAISDIRSYLNKYPYHFKEYQFIVAMRSMWQQDSSKWENTLLYRLTKLSYELHNEGIHMNVSTTVERALNLIMLYESDASKNVIEDDGYMSGERITRDYMLLFSKMGLVGEGSLSLDNLKQAFERFKQSGDCDEATKYLIAKFIHEQDKVEKFIDEDMPLEKDIFKAAFSSFLKAYFTNYQVMEIVIPRDLQHSPRQNRLALLRVVEFINKSVEVDRTSDVVPSLASRCKQNWDEVIANENLEEEYSDMLAAYEQGLKSIYKQLETNAVAPIYATESLPVIPKEKEEYIKDKDNLFEDESKRTDLTKLLTDFMSNGMNFDSIRTRWLETYDAVKTGLNDLGTNLQIYANSLSKQYSDRIEKRKKEALRWEHQLFFADEHTEEHIATLEGRRDKCLEQMKNPQMTPSLRFQDQINMETELEHRDKEIRKLIGCLKASTAVNFVITVLAILVLFVVHYTVLQPFVFSKGTTLIGYLAYIGVVFVLLTFTWLFPRFYYRRMIKKSVKALIASMNIYIPGYYTKAKQFKDYINALNLLDSSIKYHTLYSDAFETSRNVIRGCLWHKTQIKDHLDKLKTFSGLIELGSNAGRRNSFNEQNYTVGELLYSKDKIKCVEDCSLYWPQGQGDSI